MNSFERIQRMVDRGEPDRIGLAGWVHMPMVDRHVRDFTKATIDFTDSQRWDFVKLMSNGHYFAEAYGADIQWRNDPREWSGQFRRYPLRTEQDLAELRVLPVEDNPVLQREVAVAGGVCAHYKGLKPVIATIFTPMTWAQEMMRSTVPGPILNMMREHPKALHHTLQTLLETNLLLLDALIAAGIDGIFLSTQFGSSNLITRAELDEFCHPYDLALLNYIKKRTWFNVLHVHYCEHLMMDAFVDYPVQAMNWESCTHVADPSALTDIQTVRQMMPDQVIVGGIDQHHDFYSASNDREAVKDTLKRRLDQALKACGDLRFVFAPGCALPMDVDRDLFTLMYEVVSELGM